ncbi:MAG: Guanidinobutyrase [Deltaproteobacteria bacterium ADurb.Bin510]|nr:MAG: Guanidinobutyrase [Deltaproteobacteria bacterium ADurb.Bin510]
MLAWAGTAPIYLSLDLDVLDSAVLPGTGTPEPGGWSFNQLINTLLVLIEQLNVVAADVVELAPMLDASGVSTIVAAKVVRELILALDGRPDLDKARVRVP